ncbi:MAG: 2-C-methyl-D-erythritol 2,4-cyclodiphosphate synthase [Candidatus Omnitrophota bacterium]|nr:2-C-methyl-D-erythritol 2,4-cyclodiphosphate synthase [Candidatus Omnitrophota bacterium]MBU1928602.1 2-C-methyl-D-erythritol 2,4-cyclodiphosphate synthase [Candidatus Omnitrophota bacterium]MBU2034615.1 2-C-methyl-D-erythritol 2,4-cyclodiphosphate synthase [Candidatus Omnitrophota bacterium]MBU2221140.1 2-C-methyl-D-erythritol 2,4-cyclodiphosphate synthase [Candidatus Omnitrophota bacterium]MBU2258431.1 2-C-methyl-D-erythritol 2,4-cyclodiphosphate synthase [Candidatus Omnitrophota bacterium
MIRIGLGYDIHRLVKGRKLILGGLEIPHSKGLMGHSDADVLLHAISDALLGAVSLGDIGAHFPDTDPQYRNASSLDLLKKVNALIKKNKFSINNIDTIIIAEEPKIIPYRKMMQKIIARALGVNPQMISVKAKTNEGLGDIGGKKAIAAYAIVLVNGGIKK